MSLVINELYGIYQLFTIHNQNPIKKLFIMPKWAHNHLLGVQGQQP